MFYLNNRVFLFKNCQLIVTQRKFDLRYISMSDVGETSFLLSGQNFVCSQQKCVCFHVRVAKYVTHRRYVTIVDFESGQTAFRQWTSEVKTLIIQCFSVTLFSVTVIYAAMEQVNTVMSHHSSASYKFMQPWSEWKCDVTARLCWPKNFNHGLK